MMLFEVLFDGGTYENQYFVSTDNARIADDRYRRQFSGNSEPRRVCKTIIGHICRLRQANPNLCDGV
jgi:hypothetical protein